MGLNPFGLALTLRFIASWRVPIGDSGLLEFFLKVLPLDGLRQSLRMHTLRLVGNSCADTGMVLTSSECG